MKKEVNKHLKKAKSWSLVDTLNMQSFTIILYACLIIMTILIFPYSFLLLATFPSFVEKLMLFLSGN